MTRAGDSFEGTHPRSGGVITLPEQFRRQQAATWPGVGTLSTSPWVRPSDWLTLSTPADGTFYGLKAITLDDGNFAAVNCTTSSGTYHVGWGDGNTSDVASGTAAQHWYDSTAISAGTLSTRGYKQVIVTITANTGSLTGINLQAKNTTTGLGTYETGWLDIAVSATSLTSLTVGASSLTVRVGMLENVTLLNNSITSMNYLFGNCYKLSNVSLNTAAVTSMSSMFNYCYSLVSVPLFNTAAVTSMSSMFQYCSSLVSVPLFNTAAVTSMSSMFYYCSSLVSVPLFNTAAVTSMSSMFQYCSSLASVPALVTSNAVNNSSSFTNMFSGCPSLASGALSGTQYAISYSGCKLSEAGIVAIFNALGTASGTPTITVSGNYGYAALTTGDKAIATGKGWTIA